MADLPRVAPGMPRSPSLLLQEELAEEARLCRRRIRRAMARPEAERHARAHGVFNHVVASLQDAGGLRDMTPTGA